MKLGLIRLHFMLQICLNAVIQFPYKGGVLARVLGTWWQNKDLRGYIWQIRNEISSVDREGIGNKWHRVQNRSHEYPNMYTF